MPQRRISADDNGLWDLVETPGSCDPIAELRAFLDRLPRLGLSPRQEAEARDEVEEALAFRLANPLPGDPDFVVPTSVDHAAE